MKPKVYTLTLTANQSAADTGWLPVDYWTPESKLQYTVHVVGTSAVGVGAVQYTLQDVLSNGTVTAAAIYDDVSAVALSAATHFDGSITHPVAAIRLNITSVSGAPTITFRTLQSGY